MTSKITVTQFLPNYIGNIAAWAVDLVQQTSDALNKIAQRLNLALMEDGSEGMTAPLPLKQYTVTTLPVAASWTGAIIYVSNGTANKRFAVSDGTNWRFPDGNIVS